MRIVEITSARSPSAHPHEQRARPASLVSVERTGSPHDSFAAAIEALGATRTVLFTLRAGGGQEAMVGSALREDARQAAIALAEAGLRRGDRVVLLLPTSRAFIEAFLGACMLGAVPVPLAGPMTFGSATRYLQRLGGVVLDCEPRLVVTTDALAREVREIDAVHRACVRVLTPSELRVPAPSHVCFPTVDGQELALLQYTSGTTGKPKGVEITHAALVANAAAIRDRLRIGEADVGVSWLPLFHDMGLIGVFATAVCHPYPVHLMTPESFAMQPRRWVELLSATRGTISAAPNFGYALAVRRAGELRNGALSSWRAALSGAEMVRPATLDRFRDHFADAGFDPSAFSPVYGLAEATLAVTMPERAGDYACEKVVVGTEKDVALASPRPGDESVELVSVGTPIAQMSVSIADSAGAPVAERVLGEILVRGPSLMRGYFRDESASRVALRDGWLRTGDLGYVADGRLFVVGRDKELIIKSGRNVVPADVEEIVQRVDGVLGAVAFGVPDETLGTEKLVVVCETRARDTAEREDLVRRVIAELLTAQGLRADAVELVGVSGIPRTTSGKIRRSECARQFRRASA